jgi:hypothetical protein
MVGVVGSSPIAPTNNLLIWLKFFSGDSLGEFARNGYWFESRC